MSQSRHNFRFIEFLWGHSFGLPFSTILMPHWANRHMYMSIGEICIYTIRNALALILLHLCSGLFLHHLLARGQEMQNCSTLINFIIVICVCALLFLLPPLAACGCRIFVALQLHAEHFIVFHFKFNAP